ncbi:MAG TPA: hypothetical protein VFM95_04695, partial [Microcella sp.]|nr:hypothetical protein [Microcella sp.]
MNDQAREDYPGGDAEPRSRAEQHAHHGVTAAVAEVSPSLGGVVALGAHVRLIAPPVGDGSAMIQDARHAIDALVASGDGVAALLIDTAFA